MTRSKNFWAAAALISLAVLAFSAWSVYERLSLHLSGDTVDVRPAPVPLPDNKPEEQAQQPGAEQPGLQQPKETAEAPKERPAAAKEKPAAPAVQDEKVKAVKTAFEYKDAKAKSVQIAGSFTSWKNVKLTKKGNVWKTEIFILPGTYPYHFTVDGKKKLDPGKPKAPTGDSLVDVN